MIALRLLEVAGVDPDEDIAKRGLGVGESVQAIRDGSIDAFFWSGGVPTGAVTDLATTDDIRILALDGYLPDMRERFGEAYAEAEIEGGEYEGIDGVPTIGVPNLLMVSADMSADMARDITQALYEGRERLATVVPAAESLDPEKGQEVVSPVELHPGARASTTRRDEAAARDRARRAAARRRPTGRGRAGRRRRDRRACRCRRRARSRSSTGTRTTAQPARETFRAAPDGSFALIAVSSPSEAVLDYYEIEGGARRRDGVWTLRPGTPGTVRGRWRSPPRESGGARSWPARGASRCTAATPCTCG